MKPLSRLLICVGVLGALALPSRAVLIGFYPGLDALIKEADTIAIVRVESAPTNGIMVDGWAKRDCYVYQSLKGDLKANQRVKILLNEGVGVKSNFDGSGLASMSTHLVFLSRSSEELSGAKYTIICREGADIPLSPLGNEKKPDGKTLKAQIQTLVRRYKAYRAQQAQREDKLLDKALAD